MGEEGQDLGGPMPREMLEEINGQDLGKVTEKNKTRKFPQRTGWMVSINSKSA